MLYRSSIAIISLMAALTLAIVDAQAFDDTKFPDWSGQWRKPPGVGDQWDPSKRPGLAQQAPLTPEYQAILEASLADQAAGGQGGDTRITCISSGVPRMLTGVRPFEFVILPKITYINTETYMPRRIYTDGRQWPENLERSYAGYSIGTWIDKDGNGNYDLLEVETRNFKGPRTFEFSGIPLHRDNQSIVKERIYLDQANKDILHNEVTTIDNALTRPWTVKKTFRRERNVLWIEDNCSENNNHVAIGKEYYFLSADGLLMPSREHQSPPDLRYFIRPQK
jgi:hypothetical protein